MPEWHSWLDYAFETVCYKHLQQIKRKLDLPPLSFASTWRYAAVKNKAQRGAQIDLLFDRHDYVITICKIKCSDKPFLISKDYAEQLKQKLAVFRTQTQCKKQSLLTFVAASGLSQNQYAKQLVADIVTLDDLFAQ